MAKKFEIFITVTLGLFCVLIASLDIFGLIDDNHWIAKRIPPLSLLGIGAIATYLIIERRNKLDELHKLLQIQSSEFPEKLADATDNIISAINGVQVTIFDGSDEMLRYAIKRYSSAKTIDDITGGSAPASPRSQKHNEAYKDYQNTITKIIQKKDVVLRQVYFFEYLDQIESEKARLNDPNNGFNLGFYNYNSATSRPRLGFGIVDSNEVICSNSSRKIWFSVKHPVIVKFFVEHFNDLWNKSTKIKEGYKIYVENIKSLEESLVQKT